MRKVKETNLNNLKRNRMYRFMGDWRRMSVAVAAIAAIAAFLICGPVNAYTISAVLTGDPRSENPDNILVNVTIEVDEVNSPNVASWTVEFDMAGVHPNAKASEFYFNLENSGNKFDSGNLTFSGFDPSTWAVVSPASTVGGGTFTPNFLFEAQDTGTGQNKNPIQDGIPLMFDMTLTAGNFLISDFLNAPFSVSSDMVLGSGQLGMHVQSLNMAAGNATTDSGFVLGNYHVVPLPAAVWLLGSGLLGVIGFGRRRRNR
ncbi:MAG: hypothetical protein HY788_13035 [Deltaproteobacteria bacterium]|nr:hypothetical protein [Deltaproteobacteria bacterium]